MVQRIGLLGGSFDPPHLAHRALAELALEHLNLDRLKVLPAGQPWQKAGRQLAGADDRLALCQLAFAGNSGIDLDDRELRRSGPTYTIDTVLELQHEAATRGEAVRWVLIMGEDQWSRIHTWHRWQDLAGLVEVAVAHRAGHPPLSASPGDNSRFHVVRIPLPDWPLSSTDIRQAIQEGRDVTPFVGESVARYLQQHRTYQRTPAH
jgi:nicotinate-nucleotide adenylyltransferase